MASLTARRENTGLLRLVNYPTGEVVTSSPYQGSPTVSDRFFKPALQEQDVPFTTQTRLTFDVILPLWGHRGPRPTPVSARANRSPLR
jgi:hypothetical protein